MEKDYVKITLRSGKDVKLPRYYKAKVGERSCQQYVRIKGALACYLLPITAMLGTIPANSLTPYEAEHAEAITREEWEAQVEAALKRQHDLYVL